MADENQTAEIDTDNMSMDEISALSSKMREGEDVGNADPQPQPDPAPADDPELAEANAEAEAEAIAAEPGEGGSKTVPHKTFHRERELRKAADQKVAEANERYARLEERTKLLLEAQSQPAPAAEAPKADEPAIPDPDKDPVGAVKWLKEQIEARSKAEAEQKEQAERQTQEQREFQEAFDEVNTTYKAATTSDPTIVEAHGALRQSIGEELMMLGRTQQQALQELANIENQHLLYIRANKLDVGEYIKNLAKTRGWRPSAAPQPDPNPAPATDRLDAARKAAASLGSSGGAVANSGKITPDMLADMSDADFAEYMKANGSTRAAFAA